MAEGSIDVRNVDKGAFWAPNAIFFALIHLGALFGGIFLAPPSALNTKTIILTILSWQLPCFGCASKLWGRSEQLLIHVFFQLDCQNHHRLP